MPAVLIGTCAMAWAHAQVKRIAKPEAAADTEENRQRGERGAQPGCWWEEGKEPERPVCIALGLEGGPGG